MGVESATTWTAGNGSAKGSSRFAGPHCLGAIVTCLLILALVGCSSDGVNPGTDAEVADAAADGTADSAVDARADADPPADAAADAPADAAADVSTDAEVVCNPLREAVSGARTTAGTCERSSQCTSRPNDICPEGGCHTFITTTADLSDLDAAEAAYAAECGDDVVCDCGDAPDVLSCTGGQCGECPSAPGGCDYTCDLGCTCLVDACGCDVPTCADGEDACANLNSAISEAIDDVTSCTTSDDCDSVWPSADSPIAWCCGAFVNRRASTAHLGAMVRAWSAAGCDPGDDCSCAEPPIGAICVDNRCVAPT
jgi:hypothetical protein